MAHTGRARNGKFPYQPPSAIMADPAQASLTGETNESFLHRIDGRTYERRYISAEEYRCFRRDGFLIVRSLLPEQDVAELRDHTEQLMAGTLPEQQAMQELDPRGLNGASRFRGETDTVRHLFRPPDHLSPQEKAALFLRIHMLHRQLPLHERYLLHPRLLDVLEVLIGPDLLALQSMLFLKPPGKVGQGWHQDSYYIPTSPDTLCGAWIAIDDADEYNGALWLARGSGHEPVYPPCPETSDHAKPYGFGERMIPDLPHVQGASNPVDEQNTLTDVAARYDQVLARVTAGDVVFFNGHVLHRSRDNVTADRFRRAFVGHYANARSFTQWGRDAGNDSGFDEATGMTNGSHILARGDSHLSFGRPRYGTPCAALLPPEARRGQFEYAARILAAHGDGLMGCGMSDPNLT